MRIARPSGADVIMANIFQSATKYAIHGRAQEAAVKKIAIDMLATNVLYFGPTYSRTVSGNKKIIN